MFNDLKFTNLAIPATAACPTARFETLLSLLLKATASEDVMVASAALGTLFYFAIDIQERSNIMTEANIAGICVETLRRTGGFRKEAPWWKERAHQWSIEIVSLIGPWVFLHCLIGNFSGSGMPHGSAWDAILAEATHGTIVIHKAELALAQSQGDGRALPTALFLAVSVVAKLSQDTRHRTAFLSASGLLDALQFAIQNECVLMNQNGIAMYASSAVVALIGRNEEGLTMSKEAVGFLMGIFHRHFDPSMNYYRMSTKRILNKVPTSLNALQRTESLV